MGLAWDGGGEDVSSCWIFERPLGFGITARAIFSGAHVSKNKGYLQYLAIFFPVPPLIVVAQKT